MQCFLKCFDHKAVLCGTISWDKCFMAHALRNGRLEANRGEKHGEVIIVMPANNYGVLTLPGSA